MGLFNWLRDSLTGPAPCMKMVPIEPDPPGPASSLPKPPPDVAAAINRQLDRNIARRRGSSPPSPGNKPKPPAGPPEGWIDPAKRVTDLAAQAGLSPQDWAKAFNEARPQPSGGRLIRGDRDPGPLPAPEPPMQPPGRRELQWEAAIDGLRDVLTDQTESAVQPAWQRSRILTAMHLMAANSPSPPAFRPMDRVRNVDREQGFDVDRLADRLDELANFVTQGTEAVRRNFDMRVPAEPYRDADLVMSAAARLLRNKLVICGNKADHESLLDLKANVQSWYKNKYGQPYFGAIPITVAIEWGQHLLQQHEGIDMESEVIHDWANALTNFVDEIGGDGPSLWQWAGIVPTPKKVVDELRELVNHLEERATACGAAAALDIAPPESVFLPARILAMCKKRGWSLKWADRGCYLHLESSELIESLRGKRGEPVAEAADVLLVLMSITEHAGIPWADVIKQASVTCGRLEDEDFLP